MSTKSGKRNTGGNQKAAAHVNPSQNLKNTSSSESSWTTVSRARAVKHTVHPKLTNDAKTIGAKATEPDDDDDDSFTTVTLSCFEKFQQPIFALITHLIAENGASNDPFIEKWQEASNHALPFDENSTFRTITKIFGFKDLTMYRNFILECPDIETHLDIRDSPYTTNGFAFRFTKQDSPMDEFIQGIPEETPKEISITRDEDDDVVEEEKCEFPNLVQNTRNPDPTPPPDENRDIGAIPYHCTSGGIIDFKPLLYHICCIMNTVTVEHPLDPHAIQWHTWQQSGLSTRVTFNELLDITKLTGLKEFYEYLQKCPHIKSAIDVKTLITKLCTESNTE
jgi:hypothetical protein